MSTVFFQGDKKSWFDPSTFPLIPIVILPCTLGLYKLLYVDAVNPETHMSKQERGSLDYLENKKSQDHSSWTEQVLHRGPTKQWRVDADGNPTKGHTIFR